MNFVTILLNGQDTSPLGRLESFCTSFVSKLSIVLVFCRGWRNDVHVDEIKGVFFSSIPYQ